METPASFADDPSLRRARRLAAAAVFLLVLGVRLWLVGRYGSDLPFWDQWDAEAAGVLQPWFAGTLGPAQLLAAHNEHRIPLTRLIALALVSADGQWDARVQMVLDAFIASGVAAGLFLVAVRDAPRARLLLFGALLAVLFTLPYGWENTLAGFQSQFYLLVAASLLAMDLLPSAPPGSRRWVAGALAAVGALFCMGSGLVAAAAVAAALALAVLRRREDWRGALRDAAPTLGACAVLVAAGAALAVHVPRHDALRAHSAGELAVSLARYLAWPWGWTRPPGWLLLAWIPAAALAVAYVRGRTPDGRSERFVLALAAWAALQAAALARSRAQGWDASRYGDVLVFGVVANALAAAPWLGWSTRRARGLTIAFALWLAAAVAGVGWLSLDGSISRRALEYAVQRQHVAEFVEGRPDALRLPPDAGDLIALPYPDPARLATLLGDADLRALLPGSVQERPLLAPIRGRTVGGGGRGAWKPGDAPDFWEAVATFAPGAEGFAFSVEKRHDRPVLMMFARGAVDGISVSAEGGARAAVVALGAHDDEGWRPVLARCPARRCVVEGRPATGVTELTEPRELGGIAAGAFVLAWEAWAAIAAGALCGIAAVVAALRPGRRAAVTGPQPAERGAA